MATYPSEITIEEAINKIMPFSPVRISYNGECIWDDSLDVKEWKPLGQALNDFYANNKYYNFYMVTHINISTTDLHHTIVDLFGYLDIDKANKQYDKEHAAAG